MVCRKLRSDHSESQHHQHLKAAKALFIIIPLLGMPYLITLLPPTDETSYFFIFFQHTRAVLLATQVSEKETGRYTDRQRVHSCIAKRGLGRLRPGEGGIRETATDLLSGIEK